MNNKELLELSNQVNVEFIHNEFFVQITKDRYIVRNSVTNEIVYNYAKFWHSYYWLEVLLFGEYIPQ